MGMITQEAYFRQRVLSYAAKHGVTAAAIQYHMSRKTVHKWKKRYDGTVESLQDLPRPIIFHASRQPLNRSW